MVEQRTFNPLAVGSTPTRPTSVYGACSDASPNSPEGKLSHGSLTAPLEITMNPSLPASTIRNNTTNPSNRWLKPSDAAAMIGLSEKWLAAAREGRKGIDGPPFIKLGDGKTSPIRYRLDELTDWMDSFQSHSGNISQFSSYSAFLNKAAASDQWPFVINHDDGVLDELFSAINNGPFSLDSRAHYSIIWIAKKSTPQRPLSN